MAFDPQQPYGELFADGSTARYLQDGKYYDLAGTEVAAPANLPSYPVVATANLTGGIIKTLWVGTQAQYDAIAVKDTNTQYNTDAGIYVGSTLVSGRSEPWRVYATQFGAVGDGISDDTTAIQAALDTLAREVILPITASGEYLVTSTLYLRQGQTLVGVIGANYALGDLGKPIIKFRPAAAGVAIKNYPGESGCGVFGITINIASNQCFGVAFSSSYANFVRNCTFVGTMAVGVYAADTYACDFDKIAFNGASVKHYCLYVGDTNTTKIRDIYTSGLPNDTGTAMIGIGLKGGNGNSIDDCCIQGASIGISIKGAFSTVIKNPYFENVVCSIRVGDPNAPSPSYATNIIGGKIAGPYVGHPQYASRGPLIYVANSSQLCISAAYFADSHANTATMYPLVFADQGGPTEIRGCKYYLSENRAEIFREVAGANACLTVTGSQYGACGATELLLKSDDAYGASSHGIRVNNSGVVSAAQWTVPIMAQPSSALLSGAFYEPTVP